LLWLFLREGIPLRSRRVARRTRPRGFAKSARLTEWVGPPAQGYIDVPTGGATIISSLPAEDPGTIIRVRGQVSIKLALYNADLDIVGAVGIGVVSSEAFTAGVASIPTPYSDADWGGWLMWRSFAHHFEFQSSVSSFLASWSFEVDSKAMRRFSPNEVMVFIAQSQTGNFRVADCTRQLVKLP